MQCGDRGLGGGVGVRRWGGGGRGGGGNGGGVGGVGVYRELILQKVGFQKSAKK